MKVVTSLLLVACFVTLIHFESLAQTKGSFDIYLDSMRQENKGGNLEEFFYQWEKQIRTVSKAPTSTSTLAATSSSLSVSALSETVFHPHSDLPNLLIDGDFGTFENPSSPINFSATYGTIARSTLFTHNGSTRSLRFEATTNTTYSKAITSVNTIPTQSNARYVVEGYVFVNSEELPTNTGIWPFLINAAGGIPPEFYEMEYYRVASQTGPSGWQRLRGYFIAESSSLKAHMSFDAGDVISTAHGICYYDNIRVVQLPQLNETHASTHCTGPTRNDGTITINLSGGTAPYHYEIIGRNTRQPVTGNTISLSNLAPGNYTIAVSDDYLPGVASNTSVFNAAVAGKYAYRLNFIIAASGPICENTMPLITQGQFKKDKVTGQIVFIKNSCNVNLPLGCITTPSQPTILNNVVSASAVTYSDNWDYNWTILNNARTTKQSTDANSFERGRFGKWRPKSMYTYNSELSTKTRNYEAGTFDLQLFTWQSERSNNPNVWLKANTIERYTPHGEPIQERNLLGIASAAKFGYKEAVPYLTASNAAADAVFFEGFENSYGTALEDGFIPFNGVIVSGGAHSGKKCYQLTASSKTFPLNSFQLRHFTNKKMLVKFWVKVSGVENQKDIENRLKINGEGVPALMPVSKIAQTGDWILCHGYLSSFGDLQPYQYFKPIINYTGTGSIWLDDIRVQPDDAQMTTYVYDDRTLRLLTVFDDQHFGLYYQYNMEGKLVRKQIETVDGIKTIQETQYNVPKPINRIP